MATASKNSPSEEARSLLECPVCVSTFRNPKSLRCGHSVCFECCQQLRSALHVVCPVCRTRTTITQEGLPTNFALQDLIEHHVTTNQQTEPRYNCSTCERRNLIDESWICSSCNSTLICANCAIKDHHGHDLQMVSDIVSRRREELTEWRQRMEGAVREVDGRRRQIDANLARMEQRANTLHSMLRTKLEPRFAEAVQDMNAEREQLFKAINEVDVSDIIGVSPGDGGGSESQSQFQNQMNEVPLKLEALKTKQEQIIADQRLALEVVENCAHVLRQMLPASPKKASDGRSPQQSQSGAGASSSIAPAYTSESWRPAVMSRRVRLFPSPVLGDSDSRRTVQSSNDTEDPAIDFLFGLPEARIVSGPTAGLTIEGTTPRGPDESLTASILFPRRAVREEPLFMEMEQLEPMQIVNEEVTALRPAGEGRQSNNSRPSMRGRPSQGLGVSPRLMAASVLEVDMDISDEETDARILRSFGRGGSSRRRSGNNTLPMRGVGRGRNRFSVGMSVGQQSPSTRSEARARSESMQEGVRVDAPISLDGIVQVRHSDGQPSERRGRQRNVNDEAAPSGSGAGASINIEGRIRFIASDSSDDEADSILFNKFLTGRGNDKNKRQS